MCFSDFFIFKVLEIKKKFKILKIGTFGAGH